MDPNKASFLPHARKGLQTKGYPYTKNACIRKGKRMKALRHVAILLFSLVMPFSEVFAEQKNLNLSNTSVVVAFSPDDGVTQMIINEIDKAKISIYVAAYSFTSVPIAVKLIEAQKRGVSVKVVLDQSQRTAIGSIAKIL
jgi:phosphatidylserine/phosphatidylglycerophosphate/cardiolipin synthase-like enzyme